MIIKLTHYCSIPSQEGNDLITEDTWKNTYKFTCNFCIPKHNIFDKSDLFFSSRKVSNFILCTNDTKDLNNIVNIIKDNFGLSGEWNRYKYNSKGYMVKDTLEPKSFNDKFPEYIYLGKIENNISTYIYVHLDLDYPNWS